MHLVVGLPAAGKSTVARELAATNRAVRFTLDEWMLRLYGLRFDDPRYGELAAACQELIWDVAQQVLRAGADAVLDWSMWSRERRRLWKERVELVGACAVVHYVATPVDVAVARALTRDDAKAHKLAEQDVLHMVGLLEPPDAGEGMEVVLH